MWNPTGADSRKQHLKHLPNGNSRGPPLMQLQEAQARLAPNLESLLPTWSVLWCPVGLTFTRKEEGFGIYSGKHGKPDSLCPEFN